MPDINILVVDDEKEIADLIEIYLVSDGYKVFKAENAEAGLNILDKQDIHLVLLDIMMPGMNGLEMCRKIRETNNIPIIMLSAKSTDLDKILGLGTGADDYVVKPFNPLELTARVKSQLRRYTQLNPNSGARETVNNEITIKGMSINRDNHKVIVDGEEIKLTPIEFDILYLLASNPGKVFSTDEIFEKVKEGSMAKGDVLGTARIAGIMAAKKTFELIPMCHLLMLTKCKVDFEMLEETKEIKAVCLVKTTGKTGVEMEALTGVQIALLTIYDMCKAIDKHMVMSEIHLVEKTGGKSGDFVWKES